MADKPFVSTDIPMGRNKEVTNEWTIAEQAKAALDSARKAVKDGPMKPGNFGMKGKKKTTPPLTI